MHDLGASHWIPPPTSFTALPSSPTFPTMHLLEQTPFVLGMFFIFWGLFPLSLCILEEQGDEGSVKGKGMLKAEWRFFKPPPCVSLSLSLFFVFLIWSTFFPQHRHTHHHLYFTNVTILVILFLASRLLHHVNTTTKTHWHTREEWAGPSLGVEIAKGSLGNGWVYTTALTWFDDVGMSRFLLFHHHPKMPISSS